MTSYIRMLPDEIVALATVPFSDIDSKLQSTLQRLGFAIVHDVMSPAEAAECEALFAADLRVIADTKQLPPRLLTGDQTGGSIVRNWPLRDYPLGRIEPSFASDYGIPHGRCTWQVRRNANVHRVYQVLYNKKSPSELCVGLDVIFFNNDMKSADLPEEEKKDGLWPHADHSVHVPVSGAWDNFQSIVYLWPADRTTSATVVWPGSHRDVFPSMMKIRSQHLTHYSVLPNELMADYIRGCGRVPVPIGGMLVWDSKTIHQGWNVGPRLAVPVSFEPRERRSQDVLQRKLGFVQSGLPTTGRASLGLPQIAGSVTDGGDESMPLRARAQLWLRDSPQLPLIRAML
jgi:hypothetical protein